jgi:hypothetical protein
VLSGEVPADAPFADVIRQSRMTVTYPTADRSVMELAEATSALLVRLCRASGSAPPADSDVAGFIAAHLQTDTRTPSETPPNCDRGRVATLRQWIRRHSLVCGLADHGHGQLFLM